MSRNAEYILAQDELEFGYNLIDSKPMCSKALYANATAAKDDYTRSHKSLYLLAVRMHVAVHGEVPSGMTEDPGWYKVSNNIKDYVFGYGIDSHTNVNNAREARGLPVTRMKQEDATKVFLGYAKKHFHPKTMKWGTLAVHRELIVRQVRNGAPVATAVGNIVTH